MRVFRYIRAKGIPFFEDQEFRLDVNGVSVILGLNLNGQGSGGALNTNAAGKSLFFSLLKEVFFKDGSSSVARDKIKKGEVEVGVDVGATSYVVRRYLTGKTERYSILENGKEVAHKAPDAQRLQLMEILGCSQDTFDVVQYLDNHKPHPLRTGNTGVRRTFFTDFFDLNSSDSIKKLIAAEKDTLKQESAVLRELKTQQETQVELPSLKETLEAFEKANARVKTLTEQQDNLREQRSYAAFLSEHKRALSMVGRAHKANSELTLKELLKRIEENGPQLRRQLNSWNKQSEYRVELQQYKKAVLHRATCLKETGVSEEDMQRLPSDIRDLTGKLEQQNADLRASELWLARQNSTHQARQERIEKLVADTATLKKGKNCSKCKQPLTAAHLKEELAEVEQELTALRKKQSTLEKQLAECQESVDALKKDVEQTTAQLNISNRVLRQIPPVPEKPVKPETLELPDDWDEAAVRDELAAITSRRETLETLQEDARVKECLPRFLAGEVPDYTDDAYDALTTKLVTATQKAYELESTVAQIREERKRRKDLAARMEELEERLRDAEVLSVLDKAFSSNAGVKQLLINSLCRTLEGQVNKYAKFLFPEDYTFEFDLDTQFHILVTRTLGKELVTSDVRKLSGAEAGLFDLLLAISLLTFQPPAERSNLLVLDELDSGFGPGMTEAFINFLPTLNKVIPHIVIITPKSNNNYGDQVNYYTVVKQGSTSVIHPGRLTSAPKPPAKKKVKAK